MKISVFKWILLIWGLKKRGKGYRESGAFLIAPLGSRKITDIVFYDEIDPNAFNSGIIELCGTAHGKLAKILASSQSQVLADIHTHPPGCSVLQSSTDRRHPMCRIKGHIAFIAPNFSSNTFLRPRDCGAYRYLGDFNWDTLEGLAFPLKITLL